MDEEDDEIAHPLSYQFPNSNTFNVLGISPGTGREIPLVSQSKWVIALRPRVRHVLHQFE
jgi:hypothetical protein